MNFKLSLYDLFSYTIPGFLFIIEVVYFIDVLQHNQFKYLQNLFISPDIKFNSFILILIISFVIGHLISPIFTFIRKIFKTSLKSFLKKQKEKKTSNKNGESVWDLKKEYKNPYYLPSFCAMINKDDPSEMDFIQYFQTLSIMLKNIGFLLIIFSIVEIYFIFAISFRMHLIYFIISTIFCIVAILRSRYFDSTHINVIYKKIISLRLETEELVEKTKDEVKQ